MMEERSNISNPSARLRKTIGGSPTQKKTSNKGNRKTKHYFHVFQKLRALELEQELAKVYDHHKKQSEHTNKEITEDGKIFKDSLDIMRDSMEAMMDSLDIMENVTQMMETMKT